ncbi:hypothetical protein [Catenulispora rubra]|uniref:hypothetical protein n=1 Tax=Catenulispora rubra TaxID=280293 RepID=UPI001E4194DD|nr:hypothetical protein [Catenulispora rubra]
MRTSQLRELRTQIAGWEPELIEAARAFGAGAAADLAALRNALSHLDPADLLGTRWPTRP